jgi:broad specificity phosphatase PhoE
MKNDLFVTLIRHGQSVSNTQKKFGGHNDVPLSRIGHVQARLAGEALAARRVTRIISSDLSRAADTAEAIGKRVGIAVEQFVELRERDVGTLTGLTFEQAQTQHPRDFADLRSGDPTRKIGGAESYADVAARVDLLLERIYDESRGHLVLVSHMVVLQHLLRKACGVDETSLRGCVTFAVENAAFHRMRYEVERAHWHIFSLNQTGHLRGMHAGDRLVQPE